jgi:hypothetical protein
VTALGGSTDPARANCSFVNKCGPTGPVTEMRTCNPRDGLATLVAVTTGSEAFDDTNQNGKWDPGEGKTDLGEPFVDANDNGTHDSGTDNEDFYDTNNNGVWDGPNGVWDASTSIWTTYKILWTGGPDFNSAGAQASITPANNVTENHCVGTQYVLKILDINGNPPTATSGQDAVTVNPGGNVTVLHISGYYDGVTSPAAGEKQGLVLVDVMDAHSCPDCPGCGPEPYTLDFVLNRTLDGNSKVEEHPALGTRSGTYN